MQKPITIFCAFTREWAVDRWLDNLNHVKHDPALTNLCFIVDIDDPRIKIKLQQYAEAGKYRSFHVKLNDDWMPNEVHLGIRRMRIADVHNQSKWLISQTDGEYIIGLEDDTVFENPESFERLLAPIVEDDTIGFVEGVQMGRHGAHMIGAWQVDDVLALHHIHTLLPPDGKFEGLQEITGGGMYGYATQRQLYLDCDYFTSSGQPWSVDVNFGIWLRQRGYRCLIDWGLVFGHNAYNVVLWPDNPPAPLMEVNYTRDRLTGRWERRDYENSSSH
jgi:hypothetical protein